MYKTKLKFIMELLIIGHFLVMVGTFNYFNLLVMYMLGDVYAS